MVRDYVGTWFGELVVVAEADRVGSNRRLHCRCSCGSVTIKYLTNLTQGKSRSCGCRWKDRSRKGREAAYAIRRERSQESDDGRICLTCDTWKPWAAFAADRRRIRGKTSNCMECSRWRTVKATSGLSKEQWTWLLKEQGGTCALCFTAPTWKRRLSVDHDHRCCGEDRACLNCVRGLLCINCNLMLGYAEKSEANRLRFLDYLKMRPFVETGERHG
jgi:hypothetical protein